MKKGKLWFLILTLLAALLPAPAAAEIVVSFYSHELGSTFPHAFFTVEGARSDGRRVDGNYGFTAKATTPAVLWGSVGGKVEVLSASYIKSSDKQFTVKISDPQHDALMALVERWRTAKQPSYNLDKANCLHFVGQAAAILGLKVEYPKKYMRKPKSFLLAIAALNPWLKLAQR
jgi:hypothetical protein